MIRKFRRANQIAINKERMKLIKAHRRGDLSIVSLNIEMRRIRQRQAAL